ncbi:MAG TPA: NAD(P)-dependent oxidoreductase [Chloroflexota bacterium]|nr:NAD(P)-dependent oxidoreductase [Chloroflexota bacterium]
MKIFLAGATGVIGRSLIPMLINAGYEVAGTTRRAEAVELLRSLGAKPIVVDVLDRERLFRALETERPDVVIHQLTDLSTRDMRANARVRVEGTWNLVDAARAIGVRRMIAQSISFVYAPSEGPAREDEPLDLEAPPPRRAMVEAVASLERAVSELPEGVVLRYGSLYGPGTWYAPGGAFAEQARRGERAANEGITSFVHVADAARAALLALDWPAGIVNIVDDEPAPATAWLPVYAATLGAPPPPVASGAGRSERGASNAKARRELGWELLYPSWRVGFADRGVAG